jgi:5-methylcytosine-specific restriction endonuclease McrA
MRARKPAMSIGTQVAVFRRDRWLCHVCRRPVVLHLALKYLQIEARSALGDASIVYWHPNWRRDQAPLADELGASIDHVVAYASGGAHQLANFATICARCNARKSAKDLAAFREELRPWRVRGAHGEPQNWDGLASTFVVLGRKHAALLTASETKWLAELEGD